MRRRSQSGQTTAEYLGVLVAVAGVVAALLVGDVGHLIGTGARAKVCDIARHPCGGLTGSPAANHHGGGLGGFFDDAVTGLGDGLGATGRTLGSVGVGIYEGVKAPVELGIKLSPLRLQTDPIGFFHDGKAFVWGLRQAVTHPKQLGKAVLDWDTWAHDPARAVGHLIPNIAVVLATGGAGEVADGGEAVVSAEARAAAENELRAAAENEMGKAIEPMWAQAPANGFLGGWSTAETLQPGQLIDRYGAETGRFFSPAGTPLEARALPAGAGPLRSYEVVKPFTVEAGIAAPAFGEPGLGIQYMARDAVADLIDEGFIKPVAP